jgi:hypothetical protein
MALIVYRLGVEKAWRGRMGYEPNSVDLLVTRIQVETSAFEYEGLKENFQLGLDVVAAISPENDRNFTGEIQLIALDDPLLEHSEKPYDGSWIFYTENRFGAYIHVPMNIIERLWLISASKPQWLAVSIWDGPEIPEVDKRAAGKFRISYRAGNELKIPIYD